MKCESVKEHSISDTHHITIDDEFLYRKVMYFCNWACVTKWMKEHNFPIKKESIFAIDIPVMNPQKFEKLKQDIEL